jgi:hypothetical protein
LERLMRQIDVGLVIELAILAGVIWLLIEVL